MQLYREMGCVFKEKVIGNKIGVELKAMSEIVGLLEAQCGITENAQA